MAKFVNIVGSLTDPYFIEIVVRGTMTVPVKGIVPAVTVFNFRRLTNSPAFVPVNISDQFNSAWGAAIAGLSDEYTYTSIEVRGMDDPASAGGSNLDGGAGLSAADPYQTDTAVYFQFKSGIRGRSFFGSKHLAGAVETQVDAGYLNAGGVTAWAVLRTLFELWASTGLVDTAGNSWKLIVLSRVLSDLEASPSIFTGADVTQVLLNKRIGTMGRRRGIRDVA